jgi:hypothetical protein
MRPRGRPVLVLRLMGPSVSTVKIFSAFQTLVSVHSSCSLTKTAIQRSPLNSHPRAPTSMELCNRVPRGSRRKPRLPFREFIPYFMYLFAQRLLYCVESGSPWRSLPLVLSLKTTLHFSSLSTPQLRSRHPHRQPRSVRPRVILRFIAARSIPPFMQARVMRQLAQASLINSVFLRTRRGCKVGDRRN